MFRFIAKVFILVFSLMLALGIGALWQRSYTIYPRTLVRRSDEIGSVAVDFDPAKGGNETITQFGSESGGLYFEHDAYPIATRAQLANVFNPLDVQAAQFLDDYEKACENAAGRRVLNRAQANDFPSNPVPYFVWEYPSTTPNWKHGGFAYSSTVNSSVGIGGKPTGFVVVVPDWFLVVLALIAPAWIVFRSRLWRAGRRALAGQCRVCGCDRKKSPAGDCPECGAGPSWAGQKAARLGKWQFVLWWIPAVLMGGLGESLRWTSLASYDTGIGWPEVCIALAFAWMLGVLVSRAFVARQPPPEPPRGFTVVIKPPPPSSNPAK
jgi:hypothetical protein